MAWLYWLIAALVLLIFELLSGTVAALCVAIGCLPALLLAALGVPVVWQFVTASVCAVAAIFIIGPFIKKIYESQKHNKYYATGMDALIGRVGTVTHEVTYTHEGKGRVRIDGDNWLAYTDSPDQPIPRGAHVIVEAYDSIILKVRPVKNDNQ